MRKNIISFLSIVVLIGCTQSGESMELQGRIAMKGSATHSYLTIYDQKTRKNYKIQNKESFDLLHKQNQTIKVEARVIKKAVGPGFPTIIEIIEVKKD